MKSDTARSNAYNLKTVPATISLKVAAQLATMKARFAAATNNLVAKQLEVASKLDEAGILGPVRGRYHAFSNRLFKICRLYSGATATAMAQAEHDKWETVCTSAVLIDIALDVYNLTIS